MTTGFLGATQFVDPKVTRTLGARQGLPGDSYPDARRRLATDRAVLTSLGPTR